MFSGAERGIFERAKALRKQQTPAKEILWSFYGKSYWAASSAGNILLVFTFWIFIAINFI
ncbi:hypothetical protein SAMN05444008_108178 [Cnuella takakiae]|uniref:Uncharacterized protein n=1 Tax=Cnuella takakiae TaxID=1302690 RepID=A0A1M5C197_9BACT|nr:hypothetical protein SAMN05444008_108178 [Cnuella takakiae]